MTNSGPKTERGKVMFALCEKFLASGLRRKAFCQEQGIPVSTLQWWLSQFRKSNTNSEPCDKAAAAFIPIHLAAPAGDYRPNATCSVQYPNGIMVNFYGELDIQKLLQLIRS